MLVSILHIILLLPYICFYLSVELQSVSLHLISSKFCLNVQISVSLYLWKPYHLFRIAPQDSRIFSGQSLETSPVPL